MNSRFYSLFLIILFFTSCSFQKVGSTTNNIKSAIEKEKKNATEIGKNIEKEIWSGESGGHKLRITTKDIYLKNSNGYKKILSPNLTKYYENNWKYEIDYVNGKVSKTKRLSVECPTELNTAINSFVGNYIILEIEYISYCKDAAHPSFFTQWLVADLNKANPISLVKKSKSYKYEFKRNVSIFDFFSDKQILEALLNNDQIKWIFNETGLNPKPKSTIKFIEWVEKMSKDAKNNKHDYGWDTFQFGEPKVHSLTKNSLKDFTFVKIDDDKVYVNLALEVNYRIHGVPYIQIKLDLPEKLRESLIFASDKKAGFLEQTGYIKYYFIEKKKNNNQ